MIDNTIRAALKQALYIHRKTMGRASRSKQRKPVRWLYPWATEHHYAAAIRAWLRPMIDYVHLYIKNNQEAMLRGDSAALVRQDAIPGGSWRRMVTSLNGWYKTYIPDLDDSGKRTSPPIILMGLGNIADTVNDFNENQWEKAAKAELGVEFPIYEDWWPETKKFWQEQNYTLIRKMIGDYIGKINQQAEQAILSGWSPAQLAKEIQKIDGQMKAGRANLIARDQIGKLNGQVTQARMEAAGLDMYIWSTSGDERVRSSHAELDGKLCRWDDALVYSKDGGKTWIKRPGGMTHVHPGEDISCRCCALSYWDELVDEVDQKIAEIEGLDALSAQNIAAMPKAQGKRRAGAASQKQTKKKPTAKPPPATVPQPGNKTAKPAKQGASTKIGQTENSKVESAINSKLSELREWGKASKREQASMMTQDGKVIGSAKGNKSEVILSGKMSAALDKQPPNSLILLHNHPGSTSFSMTDFSVMCKNGSIKELRVVGSNGRTYRVSVGNGERPSLAEMEKYEQSIETRIKQEVANKTVMRQLPKGENMWSVYLSERNKAFAEKYGWEYKEGKLDG